MLRNIIHDMISLQVPVSMRARVTDPAVLTGPAHLNTFKVDTIEMPGHEFQTPTSITIANTADTKVSVRGRPSGTFQNEAYGEGSTWHAQNKKKLTEFGTYEVKIPLH